MPTLLPAPRRKTRPAANLPRFIHHDSFAAPDAAGVYDPHACLDSPPDYPIGHMPDAITRDFSARMHYAAYRMQTARPRDLPAWERAYRGLRDRIILGNQKLVYKAVRSRKAWQLRADDLSGDGFVVMIAATERYNPWMGIRFSTYAYTCLIRAPGPPVPQADHVRAAVPGFQADLPEEARPPKAVKPAKPSPAVDPLERLLGADHPLLSEREKVILRLRFGLGGMDGQMKLETIGTQLGLSKERIRQLQTGAIVKLREAFAQREAM